LAGVFDIEWSEQISLAVLTHKHGYVFVHPCALFGVVGSRLLCRLFGCRRTLRNRLNECTLFDIIYRIKPEASPHELYFKPELLPLYGLHFVQQILCARSVDGAAHSLEQLELSLESAIRRHNIPLLLDEDVRFRERNVLFFHHIRDHHSG